MKSIEKISAGTNYSAVNVGQIERLGEHTHVLAPGIEIGGKVFIGDSLSTTGAELSFQSIEPNGGVDFLHTHKTHEELYIFVKGKGEFQVDTVVFPVVEGSVVRVAPAGQRSVRNTSDEPLVMICVQYKALSFDVADKSDGDILADAVTW